MTATDARVSREPPWAPEAEESLIGACLIDPSAISVAIANCAAHDFYRPAHATIFDKIKTLASRGEPVDCTTLTDELRRAKLLDDIGGAATLPSLMANVPNASKKSVARYARTVHDHARTRRMIADAFDAVEAGYQCDPERAADHLSHALSEIGGESDIAGGTCAVDWPTLWAGADSAAAWLAEPVIPMGRSVALYSPAKAGKSLLALDICAAVATGRPVLGEAAVDPRSVLYVDYEQTDDDLRERLADLGYGPTVDLSRMVYLLGPNLPPLDTAAGGAAV